MHPERDSGILTAGIDLVDLDRFQIAVGRCGDRFVRRIFGEGEFPRASSEPSRVVDEMAARFSVKESVVKMLGGFPSGSSYVDISVGPVDEAQVRPVHLRSELAAWQKRWRADLMAAAMPIGDRLILSLALAVARGRAQ
jgi:phosphopantetheine--protein transferase-like protein